MSDSVLTSELVVQYSDGSSKDFTMRAVTGSCTLSYLLLFKDEDVDVNLSISDGTLSLDKIIKQQAEVSIETFQGTASIAFDSPGLIKVTDIEMLGKVLVVGIDENGVTTYTEVSANKIHVVYDKKFGLLKTSTGKRIYGACRVRHQSKAIRYRVYLPFSTNPLNEDTDSNGNRKVVVIGVSQGLTPQVQSVEVSFDCSFKNRSDFDRVGQIDNSNINIQIYDSYVKPEGFLHVNFVAYPMPQFFTGELYLQGSKEIIQVESPDTVFGDYIYDLEITEILEFSNTSLLTLQYMSSNGQISITPITQFYTTSGSSFIPSFARPGQNVSPENFSNESGSKPLSALQIACVDIGSRLVTARSGTVKVTYTVKWRRGEADIYITFEKWRTMIQDGWDGALHISYIDEAPGTFTKYLFKGSTSVPDIVARSSPAKKS